MTGSGFRTLLNMSGGLLSPIAQTTRGLFHSDRKQCQWLVRFGPIDQRTIDAAVLDVEGDFTWEIFVGGGRGQDDVLLAWDAERRALVARPDARALSAESASYGATATDLIVARDDGVTIYRNTVEGWRPQALELPPVKEAVPLHVEVGDPDGDGDIDLYVSRFVSAPAFKSARFNDPAHAKPNVLLRNDGGRFVDATNDVTRGHQNTFMSAFVDLDLDGCLDLVLSQNTGQVQILRGDGALGFTEIPTNTGYGFWMSLGLGDADRDGDLDLLFTNAGNSIPSLLTRGDIAQDQRREDGWAMLVNEGGMRFRVRNQEAGLGGLGFAWGAVFEDLDLDGAADLLVAQNYIKWPLHRWAPLPGKALLSDGASPPRFAVAPILENREFGQSPVIVDIDGDRRHDVLWLNMDGPLRAFLRRGNEPSIHVALPDDARSLGARLWLEGKGLGGAQAHVSGTGLLTDPAPTFVFAVPEGTRAERLVVAWLDGTRSVVDQPTMEARIVVRPPVAGTEP